MKDITLVYPHQLFKRHPAVKEGRHVAIIEDSLFFGDKKYISRFHSHKLVFHRSSMKLYARHLQTKGINVTYISFDQGNSSETVLEELIRKGYDEFHCVDVTDKRLSARIKKAVQRGRASIRYYESPMFLTPIPYIREYFSSQSTYLMAGFYREQRKRLHILVNKGKPEGGKWSFDAENRKKIPLSIKLPEVTHIKKTRDVNEACRYVEKKFPSSYGTAGQFWYPASHEQAKKWLTRFLEERLALFGDYEDAIHSGQHVLFHSVLTPMLNTGLLTPDAVIDRTLAFAEENRIPLNSLEGFIRQIIGWREFIRAMYEIAGEKQRTANFWKHKRGLPDAFYTAHTGIEPVDTIIRRVTEWSYCHHIERLMVLGNFMLLCGIKPDEVYRWFMELFIDAYDWVMVPNVYGMSQFADGGIFATKPYISGAHYILKMSDFKKGPWCDIWTSLFWNFIALNRAFFEKQPRLSIMTRQLDRQGEKTVRDHRKRADAYLGQLSG
ncbi:MAG: cryptochrome/photolyase family protein [Nitrospiraceae bacterium]|nr:MAG: cryptochrome/photolyase family protein [Nitrospiraceae bacterium]